MFNTIVKNIEDGFVLYEMIYKNNKLVDYEAIKINKSFLKLNNYEDITNKKGSEIEPETYEDLLNNFKKVIKKEKPIITHQYDNRLHKWLHLNIFSFDKNQIGCIYSDITDNKNVEDSLKSLALDLKRSNAELEEFAFIVSHDLQEPLRVVATYCQLIQEMYKDVINDTESKKYMNYIIDATFRMKHLIKDLLDFSRVGRTEKPFKKINIEKIVQNAISDFELYIKEAKAKITYSNMPVIVGDKIRIQQVFHNLISNAMKFRKIDEKPVIQLDCEEMDDYWLFSIKDNGVGIEEKHFKRIFGVFKRLYTREEYPGTGIGLALCKKIINNHGGKIWVISEKDKGSTFYFTIAKINTVKLD